MVRCRNFSQTLLRKLGPRRNSFIGAASLSATLLIGTSAEAFTFTEIASTNTSEFTDFGNGAINELGQVAFSAEVAGQTGIFSGDGGAISQLVSPAKGFSPGELGFNSAGKVVFEQFSTPGIFENSGGLTTPLITEASSPGQIGFTGQSFFSPKLNESGTVVFEAVNFDTGEQGLFLAKDGSITTIAKSPGFDIFRFSLNNNDQVAFFAIAATAPDGDGIFLRDSGGAPIPLPDPQGFGTIEGIVLNDSETVAFDTLFNNDEGVLSQGLFLQNGEDITLLVDNAGEFSDFDRSVPVNNAETVVFSAGLDAGGSGIFTGPDPIADKVIAVGDDLLGMSVTSLGFFQQTGLNNAGQIAFSAEFSDGSKSIFRADPEGPDAESVPEPTVILGMCLLGAAGFKMRSGASSGR
ncbi:MAG: choice-of-anchor tandem repeat NxxGxxAF-containing protein [Cyanobacteria bacterium J06607_13]